MLRRQAFNIEDLRRRAQSPARRATRRHWLSVSPSTTCGPSQRAMMSARSHPHIAAVALANKNARLAWALLAHAREYQANYRARVHRAPV